MLKKLIFVFFIFLFAASRKRSLNDNEDPNVFIKREKVDYEFENIIKIHEHQKQEETFLDLTRKVFNFFYIFTVDEFS